MEVEVPREYGGLRLDVFLRRRLPWRSREAFQDLIRRGRITVNGRPRKPSTRLRWRDVVVVLFYEPAEIAFDPGSIPLRILLEEPEFLVLDKQPGVLVHPTGRHRLDTITNALHHRYRDMEHPERDVVPRLVHRLDKATSGVLLVAKTAAARVELGRQFEEREVRKEYLALVRGRPRGASGRIDLPLGSAPSKGKPRMRTLPPGEGPRARTDWKVEERFGGHALLRVRLHTGRTHQIRVHLAAIGHPIVADDVYGDGKPLWPSTAAGADAPERGEEPLLDRVALHAALLAFRHPVSRRPVEVAAPLPADMAAAVRALRRGKG